MPKKYDGLDGTELAISECQERMAVALRRGRRDAFMRHAAEENLEATLIAEVTDEPRVRMKWHGQPSSTSSRDFLASNGAPKHSGVARAARSGAQPLGRRDLAERMRSLVGDLNVCSNKGLSERFDSTIGAAHGAHALRRRTPADARRRPWSPSSP